MAQQLHFWDYPKELKARTYIDICTYMFIVALFTVVKRWREIKCPYTNEWINAIWYIHTMKYYSALKRKEILNACYNTDEP